MTKERQSPILKSTIGFGRCEVVTREYKVFVKVKTVGHGYLDLSIKIPKKSNYFEAEIHNLLKSYIQRGKVDVFINYKDYMENKLCLEYNSSLAAEYMDYFEKMEKQFSIANDMKVSMLSKTPGILTMGQTPEDEEHMWKLLSDTIEEVTKEFVETRALEGGNLWDDLIGKPDYMTGSMTEIGTRSPELIRQYQEKLEDKVREMLRGNAINDSRIVTEVTIFADKVCVDKKTVRLRSHIEHTKEELLAGGSIGRKLGFIIQEINREANAISSKANDLKISDRAIALKTEIEKVRERIQNIE